MASNTQKERGAFYKDALLSQLPARQGNPFTEDALQGLSLDTLQYMFYSLAPEGEIPNYLKLVYDFDGVDDYITIPQVDVTVGDTITLKFIAPTVPLTANYTYFLSTGDSDERFNVRVWVNGNTLVFTGGTGRLDGGSPVSTLPFPLDGEEHEIAFTLTTTGFLRHIGADWNGAANASFPIFDVRFNTTLDNRRYLINDGVGTQVISDSLNAQSEGTYGTPNNFNDTNWEVLP